MTKSPATEFKYGNDNLLNCGVSLPDFDVNPITAFGLVGKSGERAASKRRMH